MTDLQPRKSGKYAEWIHSASEIQLERRDVARAENWDTMLSENSTTWYSLHGEPHCINGFAVDHADGTGLYYVNGREIFPPEPTTDFHLQSVDVEGTQTWTSGTGNREVEVRADGHTVYRQDGDIGRSGGPAVIEADGTEHWAVHGTPIDDPRPAAPTIIQNVDRDSVTRIGSRYVEGATTTEIVANIRRDIAASASAGVLDDLGITYKVRLSKNRGEDRPSIRVEVNGLTRDRVIREGEPMDQPFHSDEALAIYQTVEAIGASYDKTEIHNGTDSIASKFYFTTTINQGNRG